MASGQLPPIEYRPRGWFPASRDTTYSIGTWGEYYILIGTILASLLWRPVDKIIIKEYRTMPNYHYIHYSALDDDPSLFLIIARRVGAWVRKVVLWLNN